MWLALAVRQYDKPVTLWTLLIPNILVYIRWQGMHNYSYNVNFIYHSPQAQGHRYGWYSRHANQTRYLYSKAREVR